MIASGSPLPSPQEGDAPVLVVAGLEKVYKGRTGPQVANRSLDLTVRAGEIVALLGPNGAGKTTFLRQVAGQLLPTSGRIEVAGVDLVREPLTAKQFLSVIPQECEPKGALTVEEHVRYFARLKGVPTASLRADVEARLEETGLLDSRRKLVRELSGGQRRRVLLAVALSGASTRLLLLDEPTTGLDPEGRRTVWRLIDGLRARRIGILLTTHYIEEAEYLADRVVVIHDGRFVAQGTVEEIRGALPYRGRLEVRNVDHLPPPAREALARLERRYPVARRVGTTERLQVPDPYGPEVLDELARFAAAGGRATLAPVSLEDAYLAMVGVVAEEGA